MKKPKMKDMPEKQRPYEKCVQLGAEALSDAELLAVILRGREIIIPEGSTWLQEGDSVILISRGQRILDLDDIYEPELPFNVGGARGAEG